MKQALLYLAWFSCFAIERVYAKICGVPDWVTITLVICISCVYIFGLIAVWKEEEKKHEK